MRKESPIYVEEVQFCALTSEEREQAGAKLCDLTFDKRRDFAADETFAGIAVKVDFCNSRYETESPKGVRRTVEFALVDCTTRCVLAERQMKLCMHRNNPQHTVYLEFRLQADDLERCHICKLVVCDESTTETLDEEVIHLYRQDKLGHPTTWYDVECGGVMREGETSVYRSLNVTERQCLRVCFNIVQKFGYRPPMILPELELRLHYPDGERVVCRFLEPRCIESCVSRYYVEYAFAAGTTDRGVHYAELLCMGYAIAGFVFSTSRNESDGFWHGDEIAPLAEYSAEAAGERFKRFMPQGDGYGGDDEFDELLDRFISSQLEKNERSDEEDEPEDAVEKQEPQKEDEKRDEVGLPVALDNLTGLRSVKEKLSVYERVVRFNKMRADMGYPYCTTPLHAMFLGSPGTGKTTVAKMMGLMLRRAGILSKGHVVVRERATLLGQNYSSESEKTLAALEEARGGILLIDEAYQLYQPNDSRDPGKFVIETLLTALADESNRDWMLVLAGYPKEMKRMFEMNPGFKSRIPESNIYVFEDFTEQELMEIAEKYLARYCYTLTPAARTALADRLKYDYRNRDSTFGNARHVINMIQTEVLPAMAVRVTTEGSVSESSLTEIQQTDIVCRAERERILRPRVGFAI